MGGRGEGGLGGGGGRDSAVFLLFFFFVLFFFFLSFFFVFVFCHLRADFNSSIIVQISSLSRIFECN